MEDGMKQVACRYAIVQFTPYTETGEFANVGVVLICPQTGYFDFKLQTRKYKRITDFFAELPRNVYLRAMQGIGSELRRIAKVLADNHKNGCPDLMREVFEGLVHPREAIVRFSKPRVVLTTNPAEELVAKFDHYVDRSFATPEYVEIEMERRIKTLLSTLELVQAFRADRVGDDEVYARFPLVQRHGDTITKVIKPFNLDQTEPMGIYDHGGAWLLRVQRLRKRNLLPHNVLFAIRGPTQFDPKRYAAFEEIRNELGSEGVLTVDEAAQERIAEFAAG
jgi:hypothetical protein